ncbi:MAG: ATP-binding protein, partial [Treponema sp.]|nr:ATP-binding protein [Treponema sp.]
MYRKIFESLKKWKNSPDRKPLLLLGARQVGKTWLMKEFGGKEYSNTIYIDFYNNERARRIFDGDLKPARIINELEFLFGSDSYPENKKNHGGTILPGKTLIIFDEVQECNRALNSLKYFYEDANEYHIIAAGSFLGISLHEGESFPVGKTDSFTLYPMTFNEFLLAVGQHNLAAAIEKRDDRLIALVKDELIKYLKYYYFTGGMPEVVLTFCRERNYQKIREQQKRIISGYENDFSKHIHKGYAEKVIRLWNSIPGQLAREKKKFIYNDVKTGAKSRDYKSSLFWLSRLGLVYEVCRVKTPNHPLTAYIDQEHFKLFMLDVGLLSAMANLDINTFLDRDASVFNHFYGALTEQFVLQELKALGDMPVYYWAREGSGSAEVDFIINSGNLIIPIEVKAEKNLKAKSLKVYIDMYKPAVAIRASLADNG